MACTAMGCASAPGSRWPPTGPARVRAIQLRVIVPGGVPAERRAATLAVASHCTVHNALRQGPGITIDLA
jgi:putative redox protein